MQDQDADTEPTGEPKKKARRLHETSSVGIRVAERPLLELVDQIGQPDKSANIREEFGKLKARPCQLPDPAKSFHSRAQMHTDLPLTHIGRAVPHKILEIEATSRSDLLLRIRHRIALADFYCAYRTAYARPEDFLQEFDQGLPQHIIASACTEQDQTWTTQTKLHSACLLSVLRRTRMEQGSHTSG